MSNIIYSDDGDKCDDGRIIGLEKDPNCINYGLNTNLANKSKIKSESEMSFEKCFTCKLVEEIDPDYTKSGQLVSPFRLFCKVTGKFIEITKCIKEA